VIASPTSASAILATRPAPVDSLARVVANQSVVPGGAILTLELGASMPEPSAGQFVHVRLADGPLLRRPFSVLGYGPARGDGGARIELMYAVVGAGTARLRELIPGDRVHVLGPLGNGFHLGAAGALVLVAGGRGAVPLYRLIESGAGNGRRVVFLFGARDAQFVWGLDRLGPEVEHRVATVDGSAGLRGTVIDLLEDALRGLGGSQRGGEEGARTRVLACGPERMLRRVAETAAAHGAEAQVAIESPMGCAIGICRGCVIPRRALASVPWPRDGNARYATVCKEGPVFLGDEVDWEGLEHAYA
jgi:dihydroorotate dehydrogenase electron transfer subunit